MLYLDEDSVMGLYWFRQTKALLPVLVSDAALVSEAVSVIDLMMVSELMSVTDAMPVSHAM
ncbi:hypothetical protein [Vibrio tasmaniensis]|uniref:hypothetical protein n=1 Tax=Vibrio tasmaniensis TaxID=212663 RepID=UPI00111B6F47|nr:hypothetical protein [Vibrio tasmaniensis]